MDMISIEDTDVIGIVQNSLTFRICRHSLRDGDKGKVQDSGRRILT